MENKDYEQKAKRRAWAASHFSDRNLTDEELDCATYMPSENFSDGWDKGVDFALSHQWISVGERLPEDDTMVTAHSPNGRIDVLKYHDGEFIDELHQAHCVDYFIPIPQLNPEKQSI